jgi:hypothetical protein
VEECRFRSAAQWFNQNCGSVLSNLGGTDYTERFSWLSIVSPERYQQNILIRFREDPTISFAFHYSIINFSLDAIQCNTLKTPLTKTKMTNARKGL